MKESSPFQEEKDRREHPNRPIAPVSMETAQADLAYFVRLTSRAANNHTERSDLQGKIKGGCSDM